VGLSNLLQLIEVILILMAYKPDGTRQTEALFIVSRTIIAFNPLGSVSSFVPVISGRQSLHIRTKIPWDSDETEK